MSTLPLLLTNLFFTSEKQLFPQNKVAGLLQRKHLIEGSFADAANNHHFKRSHWRRLWRQQIQDLLIGAIQNIKILLRHTERGLAASVGLIADQANVLIGHFIACGRYLVHSLVSSLAAGWRLLGLRQILRASV